MNCYYRNTIKDFLCTDRGDILRHLTFAGSNEPAQVQAWEEEIDLLKDILQEWESCPSQVLFEYTIPRLNKRVDVVLLLHNIVFCIEFKVGKSSYIQQDMEQVMDYALDLKNFHKESCDLPIVPILVATEAEDFTDVLQSSVYHDQIYNPILSNSDSLLPIIRNIIQRESLSNIATLDIDRWCISRYEPTPTIIEAATSLYLNHSVESITISHAARRKAPTPKLAVELTSTICPGIARSPMGCT
jgi:hypothetical protein